MEQPLCSLQVLIWYKSEISPPDTSNLPSCCQCNLVIKWCGYAVNKNRGVTFAEPKATTIAKQNNYELEVLANRFPSNYSTFSMCLASIVRNINSDNLAVASVRLSDYQCFKHGLYHLHWGHSQPYFLILYHHLDKRQHLHHWLGTKKKRNKTKKSNRDLLLVHWGTRCYSQKVP